MSKLSSSNHATLSRTPNLPGPLTTNLVCFGAMFAWSIAFPIADMLLQSWGTVSLGSTRMAFAVLLLLAIWLYREGIKAVLNAPWFNAIFIGGLGFGIGTLLFLSGQKLTNAVTPAVAAAMMPICSAIIEVSLDKRVLTKRLLSGIILAIFGGILAVGVSLEQTRLGIGLALCVTAVFLFAWATRATTRQLSMLTTLGCTTATLAGALIVMALTHLMLYLLGSSTTQIGTIDSMHLTALILSATVSLALAQLLWIWGAGHLGILIASFHTNAVPFYVMVILVLFMNQQWQWSQAAGGLLVAAGVLLAQMHPRGKA